MPRSKVDKALYWDERGFILHPRLGRRDPWNTGNLMTKHYPWRRVRSLGFLALYPLVWVTAKDPNGAVQTFTLGLPPHSEPGRNRALAGRAIGDDPDMARHIEEFVEAAREEKVIQINTGGWSGQTTTVWEKVHGFPGEKGETAGSVYRRAAAPEEKVLWSLMQPKPAGWFERLDRRLRGTQKLHQGLNRIIDPREVAITKSYLYARVGRNSYRVPTSEYRGSVMVIGGDRVSLAMERHYFGTSAHISLRRGSARVQLSAALIEHLPKRDEHVTYTTRDLQSGGGASQKHRA